MTPNMTNQLMSMHSHSGQFCQHAADRLEDVVQQAIKLKFQVYALTEHMPRFPPDLYPEERGDLFQAFEKFVIEAWRVKRKYRRQIDLLVGVETEWLPGSAATLERLRFDVQLVVGSVHHVHGIPIDYSLEMFQQAVLFSGGTLESLQLAYYDAQYDMIREMRPHVIAHFDVCSMYQVETTESDLVTATVERNIQAAVNQGCLFEVNTRGYKKFGGVYPRQHLRTILELGGKLTLSDDAHAVADVGMSYLQALEYLAGVRYGESCITHMYSYQSVGDGDGMEVVSVLLSDLLTAAKDVEQFKAVLC